MKLPILIAALFALSLTVSAQSAVKAQPKKEAQPARKVAVKSTPLPADDKDPVCFMKVKKGTLLTTSYKGKLYGFCSEYCKGVFLADPAAQLK
jgi:YHS domain-containing protein